LADPRVGVNVGRAGGQPTVVRWKGGEGGRQTKKQNEVGEGVAGTRREGSRPYLTEEDGRKRRLGEKRGVSKGREDGGNNASGPIKKANKDQREQQKEQATVDKTRK